MNKPALVLMALPPEIIVGILSMLRTRTIITCRCVCKQWHQILLSPEFARLHLSASTPGLLVLHTDPKWSEYSCNVVEHDDIQYGFPCDEVMKFDPRAFISSPADYQIQTQNSVHGFLCLRYLGKTDDVIYVCNPITRQYISLPRLPRFVKYASFTHCGFGVSSITGQYKVVYMLQKSVHEAWHCARSENYECEFYDYLVYTLGAAAGTSWRSIARNSPFEQAHLSFGVFLNGNLHGLVKNSPESTFSISCFDLEDESFKPFSPPPYPIKLVWFGSCDILWVLDDCLCICDSSIERGIVFWTMKEYGVQESWTRQFVLMDTNICPSIELFDVIYPIKGYENGDILFSWQDMKLVFFYNKRTETNHKVDISTHDFEPGGWFKATPHNSSFLSLQSFDGEHVVSF
ncbi:F-box protein At2g23160-like [Henckelia pumila]|uniref:F-box protein At2g23160-like n=1 Tax=Henckelia pumila TaxID=405737 RepID=UPI003C6DEA5B